jgi:hypothetical protein
MTRQPRNLCKIGAILVALALPLLLPTAASAETLVFMNDTKATLVVQVATVVRGTVRRGPPYSIGPGEKARITVAGDKIVNVYDARLPNRALFQGTIPASKDDGTYSISQPDLRVPKVSVDMVKPGMMKSGR